LYIKACRGGFTSIVSVKPRIYINPPPPIEKNIKAPELKEMISEVRGGKICVVAM
jgi:hypothetical protein